MRKTNKTGTSSPVFPTHVTNFSPTHYFAALPDPATGHTSRGCGLEARLLSTVYTSIMKAFSLCFTLQLATVLAAAGKPLPPFNLKCEHNLVDFSPLQLQEISKQPLFATDSPNPRFSWSVAHTGRAAYQSAFQVRVAQYGNFTALVWDSGVVHKDTNNIR